VFVFTKGRFHQRGGGLKEHDSAMLLRLLRLQRLQHGAEIRPCIKLRESEITRQGEEGGEPG
jgi:hypothetical protein